MALTVGRPLRFRACPEVIGAPREARSKSPWARPCRYSSGSKRPTSSVRRLKAGSSRLSKRSLSVYQLALDAGTNSVLFFLTGGVSFCSGVDAPEVLHSEPKVRRPWPEPERHHG